MRSLFPRLCDAEAKSGSVIRAFRRDHSPNSEGVFRSFPDGLTELVAGLVRALPPESIRFDCVVTRIEVGNGFTLHIAGNPPLSARAVILAIPAFAVANLLGPIDAELSTACGSIPYLSTATVVFAFSRDVVRHTLSGTGFVVPRTEGISITAGAWISSKWPQRAPDGQALLRAFLGGARDPHVLSRSDEELTNLALGDLANILGIRGSPTLTRVYRWHRSSPQQEVGHDRLMKRIEGQFGRHAGLFISAAGFRGVGIPDCIADARLTASAAATFCELLMWQTGLKRRDGDL
jgi:oxygen-dependent protoporphyrinogen oxidase